MQANWHAAKEAQDPVPILRKSLGAWDNRQDSEVWSVRGAVQMAGWLRAPTALEVTQVPFLHPHGGSQPPVTPVSKDPEPSPGT